MKDGGLAAWGLGDNSAMEKPTTSEDVVVPAPTIECDDVIVPPTSSNNKAVVLPATENDCEVCIPPPATKYIGDDVISSPKG